MKHIPTHNKLKLRRRRPTIPQNSPSSHQLTNMNASRNTSLELHSKPQLRRHQPTVAPQDSATAKLVLQKPSSPLPEHEDSETNSPQHTPSPLHTNLTLSKFTQPTNTNGSRDASLARGQGTSSPLLPLSLPSLAPNLQNTTHMKHLPTKLHDKPQLRRRQSTVAPQDSATAKLVLQKPSSPLPEHEDSETTSPQHPPSPLHTNLTLSKFTQPTNTNGSRDASLARGQGTSSPLPVLFPFGIHLHPKGVEKFTRAEANEVVNHFYSLRGWISRLFKGLPMTMGNKKCYGHVVKLEVHNEGLWVLVKWNKMGQKLLKRKLTGWLTPIWEVRAEHPDIFTPFKLLGIKFFKYPLPPSRKTTPKTTNLLNTKSLTENLMGQNNPSKNNRDRFLTLVRDHMNQTGQHYLKSWNTVKQNNPELFHP